MLTVIKYEAAKDYEVAPDVMISTADRWAVGAGEYADQGEPDILVYVVHAIDKNGVDMRELTARMVAGILVNLEDQLADPDGP